MASDFNRRWVLKAGAGLAAGAALAPRLAFADTTAINYWHHFTSQSEFDGLAAVMKAFAAANPDIKVTQENIPNPEFMTKVTAAVVAKSVPDTTMIAAERVADLVAMGALIDITDKVAAWPPKPDFADECWKGITVDGKIYGVPSFAFVDWMYYRKDWFDAAGIKPPTTFDEFRDAAIKLTDAGKNRYGFSMRGGAGGGNYLINVMEAFGAPLVHDDGSISLDRDKAIEAMKWYSGLFTTDHAVPPSAPQDGFQQIMTAFQTGQTAMLWHHTGSLIDISAKLKPGVEFGTVPIPAGPVTRVARLSYAYNGLMKTDHEDAAFKWVTYWGSADAAIALLKATGYFPASRKVAQDQRIVGNPIYKAAVDTLGFGKLPPSFPGLAGWTDNTALPAFQSILIGHSSVEDAVDQMISGLEAAIS
jgi:multiple sugar transport system substrate-binding protein